MRLLKFLILLLFAVVFIQPAAAELNFTDIFSDAMVDGFNAILEEITNEAYEMLGIDSTNSSTLLTNLMISPNDMIANKQVQKEKNFTSFWFFVLWVAFLLLGAIGVMKESTEQYEGFGIDKSDSWRNKYFTTLIGAMVVWSFYLIIIDGILKFEYVLSRGVFFETMDVVPFTPANSVSYAIFFLFKLLLIIFGVYRYIVIGVIISFFLFFLAALFWSWTYSMGEMTFKYGLMLLFGRAILVGFLLVGVGIAQDWNVPEWGIHFTELAAFIVLLVDVLIAAGIIIYPLLWVFFRSSMIVIRMIRG